MLSETIILSRPKIIANENLIHFDTSDQLLNKLPSVSEVPHKPKINM